ncbi:early boundary activity protein 1-like isoform X2 [Pararge aegeria]|uniref:early boundary activity protein 1-like isoform X2 n=1 Tax=Pararge aegeria TaxID=116150 RepID=UPI0019D233CD|nr:early boundary activity protein 1-like isoform X2 [Pararge aegeria]
MTTFAVKSDLDAAHALLDLQSDYRENHYGHVERHSRGAENIESTYAIAKLLNSLIGSKVHHPHSSTPKNKYLPKRLKECTIERKPTPTKRVCHQGTQTDFELHLPEIEKMESIIQELCTKIENLESQLKTQNPEISSISASYEAMSDISSEEYSDVQSTRKPHKRKINLTFSDLSPIGGYNSNYKERDNSLERDVKPCRENKRFLKPKNNIKCNNDLVPIGDGNAEVPSRLLKNMDWTSYTTATRKLLTAVFSRTVLATHSLTGKPSPAFPDKPAKKKLDPVLVSDIVQTVVERCRVPENVVRTSITTKCADESKMFRTRQQNKKKRKSAKKENISPSDDSDDSYLSN